MPRPKPPGPDVARPKGAMGAYAFFVKICREEHKKRFPDEVVEFNEFTKKCAERWKTMTDKEKGKFHQMAELDRKRFSTEITTFNTNNDGVKKKRTRRAKDPRAPKRSMSAFFWFAADERPKVRAANPSFAVGDIAKELGKRWAEFGPTFKQKYEAKAEKDRERYVNAKQDFQQMLKDEKNGIGSIKSENNNPDSEDEDDEELMNENSNEVNNEEEQNESE